VYVHGARPHQVNLNGKTLNQGPGGWQFDSHAKVIRLTVEEDPERKVSQVVGIRWQPDN